MSNAIAGVISDLHRIYRDCSEGALADYIPELTKANPDWYGITVITADGHSYSVGDYQQPFTIQSISKAFTYGMNLDEYGVEAVGRKICVEPSGDAFNSISLDPGTGRPLNPMINAGAIAASGMVSGKGFDQRFARILDQFSLYADSKLTVDEDVYQSESATGFRNRAIAYLLRNFEILEDPVEEAVEVYFKQCSILVTCEQLAMMGASLANGGVNPRSGKTVLSPEHVEKVLSVMSSCGMYDYSGEWLYNVGLPAKSGVGGGVLGVLPGQLAVAVFSPLLDAKGNSVRGLKTFAELSERFNLHLFNAPVLSDHSIRRTYTLQELSSTRQRSQEDHAIIREHGAGTRVIVLQGDFFFAAMERVLRVVSRYVSETTTFVADLRRVGLTDRATEGLLKTISSELVSSGKRLFVVDPGMTIQRDRFLGEAATIQFFEDIDSALELCEVELLRAHGAVSHEEIPMAMEEFAWFEGLSVPEMESMRRSLEEVRFTPGATLMRQGDAPDYIYLLASGGVAIYHRSDAGENRIFSFSPGVCIGDLAAIDGSPRSADARALVPSVCYRLAVGALHELEVKDPPLYAKLIRNLLKINLGRLRRATQEIGTLKQ